MIRFQDVDKVFKARAGGEPVAALSGINLHVGRGEIFGIIGRSGAGKSTLIRTVNMLERPTAGQVIVDGVDMTSLDGPALRAARRSIGMIFQHFNLLSSRTVHDNVALPLELAGLNRTAIRRQVEPLLDLVGLTDKRDRYPAELSGGQKQRVGIARALASQPKVLLSDEATSALDPETTTSILRLLADINRQLGLTIVLITHEMTVIKEICHRVAVMENGGVIEQGTVFDVFIQPREETTRSFVGTVTGRPIPEALAARLVPDRPPSGQGAPGPGAARHDTDYHTVMRITFRDEGASQPVVSQLSRRFGLDLNLFYGRIDQIQGEPFGILVVEAAGAAEAIQGAITHLTSLKLGVEVLGHVPANPGAAG